MLVKERGFEKNQEPVVLIHHVYDICFEVFGNEMSLKKGLGCGGVCRMLEIM